ncbi:Hek2 protein [Saccharomycopsis crataegensis]|uniref:Hek2 protein n=1 Tax=Saccharomycopsis crataegensis TaxID=43959 RepID=A0AAV5QV56_9ASCO|nr:Hek2 protein [Saccharomycopsis crataegensis]
MSDESLFDTKLTTEDHPSTIDNVLPDVSLNTALITFRVLVSTKEAGIVIGKNGNCVANVREKTGVKSGVSKVIMGCSDRILTVSGPVDATAEALALFATALLESPVAQQQQYSFFPLKSLCPPAQDGQTFLRLLIPHSQMGTLIGKQGSRIKALQENYDVKIVASKEFLQDSTERVVEVQGTPENIESALKVIVRCLIEDWHGATGTIYYVPQPKKRGGHHNSADHGYQSSDHSHQNRPRYNNGGSNHSANSSSTNEASASSTTQVVDFPSDYVGCLIGKKGSKIQEIRKNSGAQISIAQEDNENEERSFTIIGSQYSVDKALSLLYQQIQREKQRRAQAGEED